MLVLYDLDPGKKMSYKQFTNQYTGKKATEFTMWMNLRIFIYKCDIIIYKETMISEEKRNQIKNTLNKTKEKRKEQDIIIIKLKIDMDKLNNKTIKTLNTMFLESKWLYNYTIDREFNDDAFKVDYKINYVDIYVKNHYEKRKINYLSSQMKQDIIKRTGNNIIGLRELKKKGFNVGKLKFKSRVSSIPLKQFNNTYHIINNYNYIKIQRI